MAKGRSSKKIKSKDDIRVFNVDGKDYTVKNNYVQNDTIPVKERVYSGSRMSDVQCIDENGMYRNVELFSPVLYDTEHKPPKFDYSWIVWDNPGRKNKTLLTIKYPDYYLIYYYQESERCKEGYEIGGVYLSGLNYFYLNYWKIKSKTRGVKSMAPHFFDLDKLFFDRIEIARVEGKNAMFLKRRQIGFSEKCAALVAWEYTFFPGSESVIIAGHSDYSTNTFKKVMNGLDELHFSENPYCRPFYKRRIKSSVNDGIMESGFAYNGIVKGFRSTIKMRTTESNAQAASGLSPTLVIMEEAGINRWLIKVHEMVMPSIQEMGRQDGRMIIYIGTGGEMDKGVAQMMKMFYNPDDYNLISVENIWDEGVAKGSRCADFFGATWYYIMDYDGNSYHKISEIVLKEKRKKKKNKQARSTNITQFPFSPSEAFTVAGLSPFDTEKLERQQSNVINNYKDIEQWGRLDWVYRNDEEGKYEHYNGYSFWQNTKQIIGVKWTPAPEGCSHEEDKEGDAKYPVMIIEHPDIPGNKNEFEILFSDPRYSDLYSGGTDSYDKEDAPSSDSVGSCSIFKGHNPENTNSTGMLYVGRLTWRPSKKEKFYDMTARLCAYFGRCKNLIEWSNIGIFDYYKNHDYEDLLCEKPELTYATTKDSKMNNKYGIDPNTKYIWEKRYASYIVDYFDNMYDLESISRAIGYRTKATNNNKKYNCDITIGQMLAYENHLNWKYTQGIIEIIEEEDSINEEWLGIGYHASGNSFESA